jgi:CO/xanthine dehydrogenase Mo-binding subunit
VAVNQTPERFGKLEALHSTTILDGGGQNNYSFAVQNVGARNMSGAYDFARSLVESEARPSQSVPSGSMRGYGSLQAHFALESMIDEIASDLKLDPLDFRLKNLVPDHKPMHTGVVPAHKIPSRRVLEKIQETPLWKNRQKDQLQKSTPDKLYGVGMALAVKSYGKSPGDTCLAAITVTEDGTITLGTHSVDMGNGTATTLPLALFDTLGRAADKVVMGDTDHFTPLNLEGPKAKDQIDQDRLAKNPRWVPSRSMSTAASAGAYQMRHPVIEAAKIFFQFSLWPAACVLWGISSSTPASAPKEAVWKKGRLTYQGHRPLTWGELVKQIYKVEGITGVMVHSFYRSQWAQGTFSLVKEDSQPSSQANSAKQWSIRIPIDALALKRGTHSYQVVDRLEVEFPPFATLLQGANRYTPYGLVVAVEIQRSPGPNQGHIKIVAAEGYLECGTVIQQDIVQGQMEGAFAMGIGQTLLEDFAPIPDGPGQGGWNLHRYQVPLARHCALSMTKFSTLTTEPHEDPKGMAEVVLNAVPPAITNAVAHATRTRVRKLPIRADDLKKELL